MADCMKERPVYEGQGMKFALDIASPGFSMDDDDFELEVSNESNGRKLKIAKTDMLVRDDGTYIFTVDTKKTGRGSLVLTTTAYVPDTDFDGGIRVEIDKKELCRVK